MLHQHFPLAIEYLYHLSKITTLNKSWMRITWNAAKEVQSDSKCSSARTDTLHGLNTLQFQQLRRRAQKNEACLPLLFLTAKKRIQEMYEAKIRKRRNISLIVFGRAGNRTQDLSHARKHAKRTLYQLSHTPQEEEKWRWRKWTSWESNPGPFAYRVSMLSERSTNWATRPNLSCCCESVRK